MAAALMAKRRARVLDATAAIGFVVMRQITVDHRVRGHLDQLDPAGSGHEEQQDRHDEAHETVECEADCEAIARDPM